MGRKLMVAGKLPPKKTNKHEVRVKPHAGTVLAELLASKSIPFAFNVKAESLFTSVFTVPSSYLDHVKLLISGRGWTCRIDGVDVLP